MHLPMSSTKTIDKNYNFAARNVELIHRRFDTTRSCTIENRFGGSEALNELGIGLRFVRYGLSFSRRYRSDGPGYYKLRRLWYISGVSTLVVPGARVNGAPSSPTPCPPGWGDPRMCPSALRCALWGGYFFSSNLEISMIFDGNDGLRRFSEPPHRC